MNSVSTIPASWFYVDDSEKTKLNWFAYEFACVLHENIIRSRKKPVIKWKARRSEEQAAEFCAYFSKRMRLSFLNKLLGNTEAIEVHGEYVSDYCHSSTRAENNAIIETVASAWVELAQSCAVCPNECMVNCDDYCRLFDNTECKSGRYAKGKRG